MRNTVASQRQRTKTNPLNLGTFNQTSLRYLKGTLGPQNKVVGYKDTSLESHGGFGGGTYNHWFKVNLTDDAWIITVKGDPRPNYIELSVYDLNFNPIENRAIFQADSITETSNNKTYYPYVDHVMGSQSDFYNYSSQSRLDKGDERYYPLPPGAYLICVSTTRNEPLAYSFGLVIELQQLESTLLLETGAAFLYENYDDQIILDQTENYTGLDEHQHSLGEWQTAWSRDHQQDDRFPDIFLPLVTTS